MKQFIICLIILFAVAMYALSQDKRFTPTIEKTSDDYFKKSRGQKLMAAGFLLVAAVPQVIDFSGGWDWEAETDISKSNNKTANTITALGIAAATGWLITSLVNRRKGQLLLSTQKISKGLPYGSDKNFTSLTLAIPLGK